MSLLTVSKRQTNIHSISSNKSSILLFNIILFLTGLAVELFSKIKWVSGLFVLCLTGPMVEFNGFSSHLLPLVPVGVLLWAAYSYYLSKRNKVRINIELIIRSKK